MASKKDLLDINPGRIRYIKSSLEKRHTICTGSL